MNEQTLNSKTSRDLIVRTVHLGARTVLSNVGNNLVKEIPTSLDKLNRSVLDSWPRVCFEYCTGRRGM